MAIELPPNRLAMLMQAKGLKLAHVAVLCDVDSSTVHRWRSGAGQIPDEQKLRLAREFGVSVSHLMGWDDDDHGSGSDQTVARPNALRLERAA